MDESRFSRNVALLGEEGQQAVSDAVVSIVGLGGLGSHVAQQLAYLGVTDLRLIDDDHISESSLNRCIGALPSDVAGRSLKVTVAERMIRAIRPDAKVESAPHRLTEDRGSRQSELVTSSEYVFGCLDMETPRLHLTEVCSEFGIVYLDLATDTGGEGDDWFGGRVVVCDGEQCLSCLGLLDQRAIRLEGLTDAERAAEDAIYGLGAASLGTTGPAVVSVNGVIAAMAVTEFLVTVAGLRPAARQLRYRADVPLVTSSKDEGRKGCPYCSAWGRQA